MQAVFIEEPPSFCVRKGFVQAIVTSGDEKACFLLTPAVARVTALDLLAKLEAADAAAGRKVASLRR